MNKSEREALNQSLEAAGKKYNKIGEDVITVVMGKDPLASMAYVNEKFVPLFQLSLGIFNTHVNLIKGLMQRFHFQEAKLRALEKYMAETYAGQSVHRFDVMDKMVDNLQKIYKEAGDD